MSGLNWTMNCVLFGAEIISLLKVGKQEEALEKIKNLTSELDDTAARYLLERLNIIKEKI